jgi:hypothetical protein
MHTISNIAELKNEIRLTENRQSINGKLLKEQLLITYASLKPGNLIMSTISDVATGSNVVKLIVGTAIGLSTGYVSNRLITGTSASLLRKIFVGILQLVASRLFSMNILDFFGKRNIRSLSNQNSQIPVQI